VLMKAVDRLLPADAQGAFYRGLILSLALALGIVYIVSPLTGLSRHFGGTFENGIHDGYWELAGNLARGNGYVFEPGGLPVMHRPPLAPLLFAPLTWLPDALQRPAVILMQSLMVGATCLLLFDLVSMTVGKRAARSAVGILLAYPWLYWHVKNPMNVITQMLCVMLIVNLIMQELLDARKAGDRGSSTICKLRPVLLGLAVAAAMLTHASLLVSAPLMLLGIAAVGAVRRDARLVYGPLIAGAVTVILVAPWTYRNWIVSGRFVPVTSNSGFLYFAGNTHWGLDGQDSRINQMERAFAMAGVSAKASEVIQFWGVMDAKLQAELDKRMVEHALSHPGLLATKVLLNSMEFHMPVVYDALGPSSLGRRPSRLKATENAALSLWHLALWILAWAGLWRERRSENRFALSAILACAVVLALPYLPILAHIDHSQYVMPGVPLLSALAAIWLVRFHESRKDSRRTPIEPRPAVAALGTRNAGFRPA